MSELWAPAPLERLAFLRITAPLAILGFMSHRLWFADHWLGRTGFSVPQLDTPDWRQPLYLPALPDPLAWLLATVMVVSGLCLSLGYKTRAAGVIFAGTLFYVALADRLAAFTVSKIGGIIALCLALSVAGSRWGLDAWLKYRDTPPAERPTHGAPGELRAIQALVLILYTSSGLCKARGEWLTRDDLLWTHLHDSYQTAIAHGLANLLPPLLWTSMQWSTLIFEVFALAFFCVAATRLPALIFGLLLHLLIGVLFGPLIWFSLLMMALLLGGFAPLSWLSALFRRLPG
ncbi:MAG: hypothetical protein EA397_02570 [Deltaproteobacteria bacterium]|nr:MAG: hypothetical protein EA397_02570 [Deltaproteobacteria bacterium]